MHINCLHPRWILYQHLFGYTTLTKLSCNLLCLEFSIICSVCDEYLCVRWCKWPWRLVSVFVPLISLDCISYSVRILSAPGCVGIQTQPALFRERCWHTHGKITLSALRPVVPPSVFKLSLSPVTLPLSCLLICVWVSGVSVTQLTFSLFTQPSLPVSSFTLEVFLRLCSLLRRLICFLFCTLVFLNFPRSVCHMFTPDIRQCGKEDKAFSK